MFSLNVSDCVGSSRSSPEPGAEILGAGGGSHSAQDRFIESLLCTHGNFQISLCIPTLFPKNIIPIYLMLTGIASWNTGDTRQSACSRLSSLSFTSSPLLLLIPFFSHGITCDLHQKPGSQAHLLSFFILPFCGDHIVLFLLPPGAYRRHQNVHAVSDASSTLG